MAGHLIIVIASNFPSCLLTFEMMPSIMEMATPRRCITSWCNRAHAVLAYSSVDNTSSYLGVLHEQNTASQLPFFDVL